MIVNKQLMSDLRFWENWYWSKPGEPLKSIKEKHLGISKYDRDYRRGQKIWSWQADIRAERKIRKFARYPCVETLEDDGSSVYCNGVWHKYWRSGRRYGHYRYRLCNCHGGLYKSAGHMVRKECVV